MVKQIPIKNRKISGLFALVDDEDYELLSQWKWHLSTGGYAYTHVFIGKYKKASMHSMIKDIKKPFITDHRDRNKLNNQKHNLRQSTSLENSRNKKSYNGSLSKYKGVCWNKRRKVWQSNIRVNKKLLFLGDFKNEIDAAKSYNISAIKYFGEFAFLNDF